MAPALAAEPAAKKEPPPLPELPGVGWKPLFDGKTLTGWKVEEEGELSPHGEVKAEDGTLRLPAGMPFTAIRCAAKLPTENFEIAADALRLSGGDIFCGLTFPVGPGHVTLVLGGWGDTVVGLSNVDGENASNNETTKSRGFDNERWYRVRVRVSDAKIEAWIDHDQVVDLQRLGRRFDVYPQLEPIRPFGFFAWSTDSRLRNIQFRELDAPKLPALPGEGWKPLFDGKSLEGWKVVAEGEREPEHKARAADGVVVCDAGAELAGIAWKGEFPKSDYEVAADAMRVEGGDFFCGMTFPVGEQAATFIVGGWGGTVVGISNLDGLNAAENETTRDIRFQKERWYRIRVRVTKGKLEAWIDAEQVVNLKTEGRRLSVWLTQDAYKPFGLNAYQTKAALRNIMLRRLTEEKKDEKK
jgi:hypothetical protein